MTTKLIIKGNKSNGNIDLDIEECNFKKLMSKMEWISSQDEQPNDFYPHLLVDGDSIYIKGSRKNPFIIQIFGEMKALSKCNWSHWMPMPEPPKDLDGMD